jgi:spore germination protein KA
MLEQFIEDNHWSLVPNFLSTERPDRVASGILEGRVAIICEGMPFALIVPITLTTLLHSPEDTNLRWQYGNLIRGIRLFAIFVAIFLPGLYVALTNFHKEMIPTDLLIAIAKARENVPFPTIVEVILMEASFELIREAGIRIPGIIGNTLGIIGALILGQASVQANLVSPVIIVIVAFTGLGNFAIPDFSLAFGVRIMRITFIIAGAMFGFYGISLCILVFLGSLTNSRSFGIPMFSVIAPKTSGSADSFIRYPLWKQEMRPDYLNPLDVRRQPKISMEWQNQYREDSKEDEDKDEDK